MDVQRLRGNSSEPTVLTSTVSSMDALCNGSSDGSATVTTSGGTAPYTYLWDDGQTIATAGALTAGSYTVTVTDANGCTETQGVMSGTNRTNIYGFIYGCFM